MKITDLNPQLNTFYFRRSDCGEPCELIAPLAGCRFYFAMPGDPAFLDYAELGFKSFLLLRNEEGEVVTLLETTEAGGTSNPTRYTEPEPQVARV